MKFLFSNILLFSLFVANAQTIKGTIIDAATGKGIGGASIVNVETKKGVQADSIGNFMMNGSGKLRLEFSATGYADLLHLFFVLRIFHGISIDQDLC